MKIPAELNCTVSAALDPTVYWRSDNQLTGSIIFPNPVTLTVYKVICTTSRFVYGFSTEHIVIGIDHLYGLRCRGWYCNPAQHSLCRPARPLAISILPRSQFYKKQGKLAFSTSCTAVRPHDDGTASDVKIGMWRHNQQAMNHEHNGKAWFSFPK